MNIHRFFSFIVIGSLATGSGPVLAGRGAAPTPTSAVPVACEFYGRTKAVALPAGVSAEWWAAVQGEIRSGTDRLSTTPDWTAEAGQDDA